ncbi:SGNH/GDSL hydrolase family protein [Flavobacterium wongokense]|uniref:SGNH/GDSL hydrolase family protein n=1 Tax=Flavobacterium wongokense TaxID=2910674 RepID=UPI001F22AB47|nr:SGNH/GDSL hydrolase family protein [Flavobacterium sp. WG47]MCF6131145.1 SGNH/GDSL hydrolase family protein [Flavobacterium sp. WG47]
MKQLVKIATISLSLFLFGCSVEKNTANNPKYYKYLALGDSYTIGESVCATCRFPAQLKDSISNYLNVNDSFQLKIIATTGWTTSNLKAAVAVDDSGDDYDLVTLLIGVNNQYQHMPFSVYEQEFPELVTKAIQKAKGDKNNVMVISIPDYAYTPFGNGNTTISTEIDNYNAFAQNYCQANSITFMNITDITRLGLTQPELVAGDGLHPSEIAYTQFVERILPLAKIKIAD